MTGEAYWLPIIFVSLMGVAILAYAILDGYDLGVGILLPLENEEHRDTMIASIGPFWDANETWLVLAVGLLLIAFPTAHSTVLYHLYLPAVIMLIGLIMRGVAFDFRAKVAVDYKFAWDCTFKAGSLITTLSQGYMLGLYVMGFRTDWEAQLFTLLSCVGVTAAYSLIGAAWLILKTENDLQKKAIAWAKVALRITFIGIVAVCIVNPVVNEGVFDKWFTYPRVMFVLLIPVLCISIFIGLHFLLNRLPRENDHYAWLPFVATVLIFVLSFIGLGFSFYPYIIPWEVTIWQAASAPESLQFILMGSLVVVPTILAYTICAYYIFRGKATDLKYY
jgi:cytochrome d ubiquinol oxidase subunit II